MFLSVFCKKVVQNRNAEDYAEGVTHDAIDGSLSRRRSVGGDRRLEVHVEATRGILTKCEAMEGTKVHRLIERPSWKTVDHIKD